jgi:hypothetical protein
MHRTYTDVEQAMRSCRQNPAQTIWEHGLTVAAKFSELHNHLTTGEILAGWRLPAWCEPSLLAKLLPIDTLQTYQLWHDCGKPYCRTVDETGQQHFPNHAEVSKQTWLGMDGDLTIGRLIGMDMDVHLLKADGVAEFAARPEAVSLLLTGLSELHANAGMFGGIESTGFKIKLKALDKAGKRILAAISS